MLSTWSVTARTVVLLGGDIKWSWGPKTEEQLWNRIIDKPQEDCWNDYKGLKKFTVQHWSIYVYQCVSWYNH